MRINNKYARILGGYAKALITFVRRQDIVMNA